MLSRGDDEVAALSAVVDSREQRLGVGRLALRGDDDVEALPVGPPATGPGQSSGKPLSSHQIGNVPESRATIDVNHVEPIARRDTDARVGPGLPPGVDGLRIA